MLLAVAIFFLPYIFQELVQLKGRKLREPEAKERRLTRAKYSGPA